VLTSEVMFELGL